MKIKTDERYFRSSDFYLCCFLFAKNINLVGIDKDDPKRSIFAFENSVELQELVEEFFQNKASVNPRLFASAIKEIKQQIYSNNF
ncbi:MAG: DUF5659 domain-containing protein [Patescibacteria group bacterium]